MRNLRNVLIGCSLVFFVAAGAFAQGGPTIRKIEGSPLTINVAADGSFQVFNDTVPGTGQMYPSSNQYGDAGIFANINGTLFAPHFAAHGGTATGAPGTPWTQLEMTQVTGQGTRSSPYTITLRLGAGSTGVELTHVYEYTNGDNYFRMTSRFAAQSTHTMNVFIGADIYLASSDAGRFFYEDALQAPGGRDCADPPTYAILIIPLTPASRFSATNYSSIWSQIVANELNNQAVPGECVDNGAAVQWTNAFQGSTSVELETAVSFGDIPVIAALQAFTVTANPAVLTLVPGQSAVVDVTTARVNEEFNEPLTLFTENLPDGITVTFDPATIAAPGNGTSRATVNVGPNVFPATYRGIPILARGGNETHGTTITVDVVCDPPFITALNAPQSQSIRRGQRATLRVKPEQEGAYTYQWYSGFAGMTWSPISGATSAEFTTPPVNDLQAYWVRVTNACGSADVGTAVITPSN